MANFIAICPRDDGNSRQASDWYALFKQSAIQQHSELAYIDDYSPADIQNICGALRLQGSDLILYFGHGTHNDWRTNDSVTVDKSNIKYAKRKAVVSIACKTGRDLGPDAVNQGGVESWLGFTIRVAILPPYLNQDPIGDAINRGICELINGGTMRDARNTIESELRKLITDYDTGGNFSNHPNSTFGYFACLSLADNVSLNGKSNFRPL